MDRNDDRYWKFGMFYVNRDDPALVVPKRYLWGRTLNYGHPVAWLWTFGAPLTIAILTYLSRR